MCRAKDNKSNVAITYICSLCNKEIEKPSVHQMIKEFITLVNTLDTEPEPAIKRIRALAKEYPVAAIKAANNVPLPFKDFVQYVVFRAIEQR
ncbi:MAG: hypothetical protein JRM72_01580 [Nitrososphaerota archaeon]|jgi:hypothetical protein|nr:hypothetical protein [Nitrososphaerota archaeon]